HRANFFYSGRHRAEGHEARCGLIGYDAGEGRLAGPGRAPEDQRLQSILLDHLAERAARTNDLLLAHEIAERPRSHSVCERAVIGLNLVCAHGMLLWLGKQSTRLITRETRLLQSGHIGLLNWNTMRLDSAVAIDSSSRPRTFDTMRQTGTLSLSC